MENGSSVYDKCVTLAENSSFTGTGLENYVICGDRATTLTG
jgi:hypothetical protein